MSTTTSTATSTVLYIYSVVVIITSTPPRYKPVHIIRHRDPRHSNQKFRWSPFTVLDLIILNCCFDFIRLNSFLIRFDSRLTYLFLIHDTELETHSSQDSRSPTLARISSKYSNTEILEYSTIMIHEIVFDKNTLTKKRNQRREQTRK